MHDEYHTDRFVPPFYTVDSALLVHIRSRVFCPNYAADPIKQSMVITLLYVCFWQSGPIMRLTHLTGGSIKRNPLYFDSSHSVALPYLHVHV